MEGPASHEAHALRVGPGSSFEGFKGADRGDRRGPRHPPG